MSMQDSKRRVWRATWWSKHGRYSGHHHKIVLAETIDEVIAKVRVHCPEAIFVSINHDGEVMYE